MSGQVKWSTLKLKIACKHSRADGIGICVRICALFAWFELRCVCNEVVRWFAMGMKRAALVCVQIGIGWDE